MEAELLEVDFEAELRAFQRRRSANRSAGRHLSDCIHYQMVRLEPRRFGLGEIDPAIAQVGFIWEDVMSMAFASQLGHAKQIEIVRDGIFMTLDGFSAKSWRVLEDKCTKMSARNPIRGSKFYHWHMQIMAYCFAMETFEAELRALFMNGSYELAGGRFGKQIGKAWKLHYTKRELIENWDSILYTRDQMDKEERAA